MKRIVFLFVLLLALVVFLAAQDKPQKVPAEVALKIREAELRQARAINTFQDAANALERARREHQQATDEIEKLVKQAFESAKVNESDYTLDITTLEFKPKAKGAANEKKPPQE